MKEVKQLKLGELISYCAKGIPPKYSEEDTDNTIIVLNQKTNRDFKIDFNLARKHDTSKKKVPEIKMLQELDILVNSTGMGTAGRVAQLFDLPSPTTVDGHMIIIRPDSNKIDPIYLGYAIKAQQRLVESFQEGSTGQTEMNRERLKEEVLITFPIDTAKQREIGRFFQSIDEKIILNQSINDNLAA